ncbi:hypothetical protein DE146DRAFT_99527 [Phaeosphaeria sp. MPI-PUGE-AT-0046c]|nr:hypothetical protein DE146DRAFT_99527 [Phaeosphaeria sp. MPI-PUGE-AT-0046c]
MSDIEKSFAFLNDNIPQWLQDIAALEERVAAMQQDVIRAPASTSPFPKRRTDSVESIKHDRMGAIREGDAPSQSIQTDPLAGRKRKALSINSGRASGPSRYRPRTMVVVKYDGDVQKSFEVLVRAIGTGRNMLRKAKMEAKMNELAALAGPSDDDDEADDDEDEAIMAKVSYRPHMSSMRPRQQTISGAVTPAALFDTTDKTLEHAQILCEKAAHVLLRDGDCRTELGSMRKGFSDVHQTAQIEVTKWTAARTLEPQALASLDNTNTTTSLAEPSYKKHFPQLSKPPPEPQPKRLLPSVPLVVAPTNSSKVMEIEVDDDDDDDEPDFVMPVRFTSRFAVRAV